MSRALLCICTIAFLAFSIPAKASDFMDLIGVNKSIDRSIAGLQSAVDRARDAGFALEAQADKYGQKRLAQVDEIVQRAMADFRRLVQVSFDQVDAIAQKYILQLMSLEKAIMTDLSAKIQELECAVNRSLEV